MIRLTKIVLGEYKYSFEINVCDKRLATNVY